MDLTDKRILKLIQDKADLPLSELARKLGLSKTACWNRIRRLEETGVITGRFTKLNRFLLDLPVVIFLDITVRRHTKEWVTQFQALIDHYPEIVEVHRLTGDRADYRLKILCASIEDYDNMQQYLISKIEFNSMSSHMSLLEMKNTTALPIDLK